MGAPNKIAGQAAVAGRAGGVWVCQELCAGLADEPLQVTQPSLGPQQQPPTSDRSTSGASATPRDSARSTAPRSRGEGKPAGKCVRACVCGSSSDALAIGETCLWPYAAIQEQQQAGLPRRAALRSGSSAASCSGSPTGFAHPQHLPQKIRRSSRPGRSRAASMRSGREVAATTHTPAAV